MDDKPLLTALKKGDEKAFDALFAKYAANLYYFSLDMVGDKAGAEEVLQETFLRVWEKRETIDPEHNFRNYLFSIAKNLIYDALRRKLVTLKYHKTVGSPSFGMPETDDALDADEIRKLLLAEIDKLPVHQRQVLKLKGEGMSNEEIAQALGISKRTVEYHLGKAYKQLRSDLAHLKDVMHLVLPLIICLL